MQLSYIATLHTSDFSVSQSLSALLKPSDGLVQGDVRALRLFPIYLTLSHALVGLASILPMPER